MAHIRKFTEWQWSKESKETYCLIAKHVVTYGKFLTENNLKTLNPECIKPFSIFLNISLLLLYI